MSKTATLIRPETRHFPDLSIQCESLLCALSGKPHAAEWVMVLKCGHSVFGCTQAAAKWIGRNSILRIAGHASLWICKLGHGNYPHETIERI